MKQRIDEQVKTYLNHVARQFSAVLGEMEPTSGEVVFKSPPKPLKCVRIRAHKSKFFLGGFYAIQIICTFDKPGMARDSLPISICYKGWMLKGQAYFKHNSKNRDEEVSKLNGDAQLIETLNGLDLEKGEILLDDERIEIKLTPLNGSYMYMVVPPMRYSGSLRKCDIEGICRALVKISGTLLEQTA